MYWQQTPLMYAAALNRGEAIRALMAKKADPGLRSHAGLADGGLNAANQAQQRRQQELLDAL
jgi:ankyrin repeat protein